MTTITVNSIAPVATPRGAAPAAALFHALLTGFAAWRSGRARRQAAKERAAEAAEVRALAHRMMAVDRGYASDLLAAADRHNG